MKKEMPKRFLVLLIFSILTVALFATVISAQDPVRTAAGTTTNWFKQQWENWKAGTIDDFTGKLFILLIVFTLIYLLLSFIPGLEERGGTVLILSLAIAFLSTTYISPQEVLTLIQSYTAIGLTITALVPILLFAALTYKGVETNSAQLIATSQIAWLLYAVFSIYRLVKLWGDPNYSGTLATILLVTAIIAAGMVAFGRPIRAKLRGIIGAAEEEATLGATKAIGRGAKALKQVGKELGEGK